MKYAILYFLLTLPVCSRAQIKLEHTYDNCDQSIDFGLVEVDSGDWRYVRFNQKDSVNLYYLDHSLDRTIILPGAFSLNTHIILIVRGLFDLSDQYGIMIQGDSSGGNGFGHRIYMEDGRILFSCEDCYVDYVYNNIWGASPEPSAFIATNSGSKMIVLQEDRRVREVYSLPGKLPGCSSTTLGIHNPSGTLGSSTQPGLAYPNPSEGSVRIAYDLPPGVSSGELIVTSEDGREVKRYHITSAFNDLLIENSGLPSGSYFYRVETEKGASESRRIVWLK